MKEEFKDIKGYEGIYQVSNLGRVKSFWFGKEKILAGGISNDGYPMIGLCKNKKQKTFKIHRLVAIAFIDNIENKKTVNHINGIKQDNSVINLEWNNHKENMRHAWDNGLFNNVGLSASIHKRKIVLDTSTGIFYSSVKECAKLFGVNYSTLKSKLNGQDNNNTNFIYA